MIFPKIGHEAQQVAGLGDLHHINIYFVCSHIFNYSIDYLLVLLKMIQLEFTQKMNRDIHIVIVDKIIGLNPKYTTKYIIVKTHYNHIEISLII